MSVPDTRTLARSASPTEHIALPDSWIDLTACVDQGADWAPDDQTGHLPSHGETFRWPHQALALMTHIELERPVPLRSHTS